MAKTLSATGLTLATLRSTMANDNSDSVFLAFLIALEKWLLGTIILSPYLRSGRHYMARFDPDPNNTRPTARLTAQR